MTSFLGWTVIVTAFAASSLAILWPFYRLVLRRRPSATRLVWVYWVASAACSVLLWYLIPPTVHALLGRASP